MTVKTRFHLSSLSRKVHRILPFTFLVVLLLIGLAQPVRSQGVSPALDLDRSGAVDPNDLFLFASIWRDLYDLGPRNFNIADYFPLDPGNRWHFTAGPGQPTGGNFAFVVESETQPLPGGSDAVRILNDYDDPMGTREGISDFWRYDASGNLFYEGFSNSSEIFFLLGFVLPPQTVYFSRGLAFGEHDQEVGETLVSSATAGVMVEIDNMVSEFVFDVSGTIQPTGFLPTFTTELGDFTDVLRMSFDVIIKVPVGQSTIDIDFFNNTVFFKKGIGPIAIDLSPDVNDSGALTIDMGTILVNGTPTEIVAQ